MAPAREERRQRSLSDMANKWMTLFGVPILLGATFWLATTFDQMRITIVEMRRDQISFNSRLGNVETRVFGFTNHGTNHPYTPSRE